MGLEEDFPEKTLDELLDADEDDEYSMDDEELEEMRTEFEEKLLGAQILFQTFAIFELFLENEITMKEYVRLVEAMEDIADERGADLP
jgi:hypothetical protein